MRRDADQARLAILAKRAEMLARTKDDGAHRQVLFEAAIVGVGLERFAIPAHGLRGIERMPAVARLPGLPAWLLGTSHVHGELAAVIDLGAWLRIEGAHGVAYLALLEARSRPLALGVEAVLGFKTLYADEVTEPGAGPRSRMLSGITRDAISVLDVERLVDDPELMVGV